MAGHLATPPASAGAELDIHATPQPAGGVDTPHGAPPDAAVDTVVEDQRAERTELPVALERLGALLSATLSAEGVPGPARVDLTLVDPPVIADLNASQLGGSGPTDVLSFPLDPWEDPWPTAAIDGDHGAEVRFVGDVVLAPAVAEAQAEDHAGTFADELALLVVHAGLHLAGHDHAEPPERAAMVARERAVLARHWGTLAANPWVDTHAAGGAP
ncbi:MAG: rRNA maturation RNase YbeY [Microthrixaceae bacterium]